MGVTLITSTTEAEMRLCTSLVDERFGETTEIIEPWSAEVGRFFPVVDTGRKYTWKRRNKHDTRRKKVEVTAAGRRSPQPENAHGKKADKPADYINVSCEPGL